MSERPEMVGLAGHRYSWTCEEITRSTALIDNIKVWRVRNVARY
jgi:hypothetical protein